MKDTGSYRNTNQVTHDETPVVVPPWLAVSLLRSSPPTTLHPTYMHLRIELLGWGRGRVGPGHVDVGGHVVVAVDRVPAVGAGGPGQSGLKR